MPVAVPYVNNNERCHSVFRNGNFNLLFSGSSISALGDQFTLVALPWLVLKVTGNPGALGAVLAVMAAPRALLMLIGGAVVDRVSPRRVLLVSRAANAVCIALLAVLVSLGTVHMWAIYLLALGIGLSTAFAYPAGAALLPLVVKRQNLRSANALFMGAGQLAVVIGPALAGFVVALGGQAKPSAHFADAHGMGLAFSIDAATFLFSLATLLAIRVERDLEATRGSEGILTSAWNGFRAVWRDPPLRAFMIYAALAAVFVGGPIEVGLPVLADTRLTMGAASLGVLIAANGAGTLVGSLMSGFSTRLARGHLGTMFLCAEGLVGPAIASLAVVHATLSGAVVLAAVGLLEGTTQVALITWIQKRVPQLMMGRTMSVLMFVLMGLGPVSSAAAGALLKTISLTDLFSTVGIVLMVIALGGLLSGKLSGIQATE